MNGTPHDGFDDVHEAIAAIARGEMVVVLDDASRENEADLVMAAQHADTNSIAFFVDHTSGYICAPMSGERADALDLPLMVYDNQEPMSTAFTITTDAAHGITTGISAADRATTLRTLASNTSRPDDLVRPGHVLPLRAHTAGVLGRPGHTEAGIDLCIAAGLSPVAVICELVTPDCREMLRGADAITFARTHQMPVVSIADIARYRSALVSATGSTDIHTTRGSVTATAFQDSQGHEHLAIVVGDITEADEVLVRIHSECMTGDLFGSLHCDCGPQLEYALEAIEREGAGVVVYLTGHEGRGIGLGRKLRAYQLQRTAGLDTVDANLALGCAVDDRDYSAAASILKQLGAGSIRLLTNNPDKQTSLTRNGIEVTGLVPIQIAPTAHNVSYLATKRDRLHHLIG
ncbi:3,4-dihydroxy-2-butanone-4-phosphate synthase (plasmid) [Rhodococcus sp. ZPP]|uniref:3,4-dihydroxy-2-butanone-4-phosphate synthase n=1 Tax=Rhodococcus sp. ZPP TaxID=2749906 RepID=UPI001AD86839|nr:3,4-dihydroxy-2-butanone-4-phosphate synthase [Rhodococcus sp. ZPP]QTJ70558.1 3,4-dihydroxy-2-butanone-4-phosphate synthase [Rhodococcus sp. ZPP]